MKRDAGFGTEGSVIGERLLQEGGELLDNALDVGGFDAIELDLVEHLQRSWGNGEISVGGTIIGMPKTIGIGIGWNPFQGAAPGDTIGGAYGPIYGPGVTGVPNPAKPGGIIGAIGGGLVAGGFIAKFVISSR